MSNSYIPSVPVVVDNTALIADIVSQINANTNAKATATQAAVVADGDVTQAQLATLTTVNGDISTDVQAINAHVTAENDRVLANIPSNSPIKSVQRGEAILSSVYWLEPIISAVDVSKSFITFSETNDYTTTTNAGRLTVKGHIKSATSIYFSRAASAGVTRVQWEVIEYV